jgi:hypothetical protein
MMFGGEAKAHVCVVQVDMSKSIDGFSQLVAPLLSVTRSRAAYSFSCRVGARR